MLTHYKESIQTNKYTYKTLLDTLFLLIRYARTISLIITQRIDAEKIARPDPRPEKRQLRDPISAGRSKNSSGIHPCARNFLTGPLDSSRVGSPRASIICPQINVDRTTATPLGRPIRYRLKQRSRYATDNTVDTSSVARRVGEKEN